MTRIAGGGPSRRARRARDPGPGGSLRPGTDPRAARRLPSPSFARRGRRASRGAHEGTAEKDDAVAEPTQAAAAPRPPGRRRRARRPARLLRARAARGGLAREHDLRGRVVGNRPPAARPRGGSGLGHSARCCDGPGRGPPVRAGATVLLAVAPFGCGALPSRSGSSTAAWAPSRWRGPTPMRLQTVWDEPLRWLRVIVDTGAEQLAGAASGPADETWDILVVLMGSGLAALLACLSASRALRGAAALVPLALARRRPVHHGPRRAPRVGGRDRRPGPYARLRAISEYARLALGLSEAPRPAGAPRDGARLRARLGCGGRRADGRLLAVVCRRNAG